MQGIGMSKNSRNKTKAQVRNAAVVPPAGADGGLLSWLVGAFGKGGSFEWVKSFGIAVGLALVIRWTLAEPFRIPSGSMEPTLNGNPRMFHGDRVFVNKWRYGLRYPLNHCRVPLTGIRLNYARNRIWSRSHPRRWDIVVFKAVEPNAVHTTLVKRVVGLPGERIHIANGKVYANGEPLTPPPDMPPVEYTSSLGMEYGVLKEDRFAVVPEGHYLLLGDNSGNSRDGRYFGWVPEEYILGRVSCIWWPPQRWRDFTGFSGTWWWRGIVAAVSILTFWRLFLGRSWRVANESEEGKVRVDHLYINRLAFGLPIPFVGRRAVSWAAPKRGQLVLFAVPGKREECPGMLVCRVAGLPGERVYVDGGRLTVDGQVVDTPPCLARVLKSGEGVGPYGRSKGGEYSLVPEGHVFVLTESDDPADHWDSRTLGWIPAGNLTGTATAVWWPPRRWRRLGSS